MNILNKLNLLSVLSLSKTIRYLSKQQRVKLFLLLLLLLLNSVIDIVGISSILPVISVALKPSFIETNSFLNKLYTVGSFQNTNQFIIALFSGSFFLIIVRNFLLIFTTRAQAKYSYSVANYFSREFFKYYSNQSLAFLKENNSAYLIRCVTNIPQHFANFILGSQLTIISESIMVLFIISGLIYFNISIFFMLVITIVPMTVVFYSYAKKRMQKFGSQQNQLSPVIYSQVSQAINGYVDMKLYGKEHFFLEVLEGNLEKLKNININLFVIKSLSGKIIELMAFMGVFVLLIYSLFFTDKKEEFLTLIGIFLAAAYRLIPTYNRILHSLLSMKEFTYMFEIFDGLKQYQTKEKEMSITNNHHDLSFLKSIKLNNINFRYTNEQEEVIKHLNLQINKGDIIGYIYEGEMPTSDAPHVHYQVLLNGGNVAFGSNSNSPGAPCDLYKILPDKANVGTIPQSVLGKHTCD